jgi:hypothetical protein
MPLLLGNTASAGGAEVVTAGLVMHLDASKPASYSGSGTVWYDISGNGYNASLVNGVSYSSTNGGYIQLDGSNGHIQLPGSSNSAQWANQTFSIDMWWDRYADTRNYEILWSQDYTSHSPPYYSVHIRMDNASAHSPGNYFSGAPGWATNPITTNVITGSAWNHFVFVRNSNGDSIVYKNGTILHSVYNPGTITYYGNPLWIGKSNFQTSASSRFGSVRYYNRALTSTEVATNFAATKTRFGL